MGQYHYCCNLTKKEFIHPHKLGDGLKAWEQCASGRGGVGSALVFLLAHPEARGGGDMKGETYGRWFGDRIALVGDYHEPNDLPADVFQTPGPWGENHGVAQGWKDITEQVRADLSRELALEYSGDGWLDRKEKPYASR